MKVVLRVLHMVDVSGDYCSQACRYLHTTGTGYGAAGVCKLFGQGLNSSSHSSFWRCGSCRASETTIVGLDET